MLFNTGIKLLGAFSDPEVAAFDHLIFSEAPRFPELFREFHDQGSVPFTERVICDIERLSSEAGWPISDARSVAVGFISSLLGWYRTASMQQEMTSQVVAQFVARQVAIMVGGRAAW
nr:TetR/AcrR family transcriptional regulator C-terminal domain-containing protein [Novosphingobium sp. SG751A]